MSKVFIGNIFQDDAKKNNLISTLKEARKYIGSSSFRELKSIEDIVGSIKYVKKKMKSAKTDDEMHKVTETLKILNQIPDLVRVNEKEGITMANSTSFFVGEDVNKDENRDENKDANEDGNEEDAVSEPLKAEEVSQPPPAPQVIPHPVKLSEGESKIYKKAYIQRKRDTINLKNTYAEKLDEIKGEKDREAQRAMEHELFKEKPNPNIYKNPVNPTINKSDFDALKPTKDKLKASINYYEVYKKSIKTKPIAYFKPLTPHEQMVEYKKQLGKFFS